MILAGIDASPRFCYEQYLLKLDDMFHNYYGSSPMNQSVVDEMRTQIESLYAH